MSIRIAAYPKCFEYDIGLHRTMTVFDWISLAKAELNVEGLEMYERFFTSLDRDYLQQVLDTAHEADFVIPMFICSPDFTHPNPDERKRALDYEAKMIEVAHFLGGEGTICRVLSGQQHPGVYREQGVEWVVDAIQKLIPVARSYGVILGMENHYKDSQWIYPDFALKTDIFLEITNEIDERQYFGVQYDPSNAIIAGDDSVDFLKTVQDRVVSMHASDRYFKPDVTPEQLEQARDTIGYGPFMIHGVIGKGLNDYESIFRILSSNGYHGWVSIEDGLNGMDDMRTSLRFLETMRARYFS